MATRNPQRKPPGRYKTLLNSGKNQLRLIVFPVIYKVLYIPGGFCGFLVAINRYHMESSPSSIPTFDISSRNCKAICQSPAWLRWTSTQSKRYFPCKKNLVDYFGTLFLMVFVGLQNTFFFKVLKQTTRVLDHWSQWTEAIQILGKWRLNISITLPGTRLIDHQNWKDWRHFLGLHVLLLYYQKRPKSTSGKRDVSFNSRYLAWYIYVQYISSYFCVHLTYVTC